jgi:iron(III) transport system permease protein
MRAARFAVAVVLALGLAAPAVAPFVGTILRPASWDVWREGGRIGELVLNTVALAAGAILVAVPAGTVGGVVLARVPFPGRRAAVAVVALGMFVPLPVYAVAWQVILSGWITPTMLAPGKVAWRPWTQGLVPAVWVHGAAAVPWVIAVVAAGLATADGGLEEDALVAGGPRTVFRRVLLPRVLPAAAVAAGWIVVQCATEIVVTDPLMVRTVAEEAYTQLAVGYRAGAAAAAAVTFPFLVAAVAGGVVVVRRIEQLLPSGSGTADAPLALGFFRAAPLGVWVVVSLILGLPLAAIVWKAAGGGTPAGAGLGRLADTLSRLLRTDGTVLVESLLIAAAAGLITAALAWTACGLARRCRWLSAGLLVLCVTLWLTPGPLLGFGLKEYFDAGMTAEDAVCRVTDFHPAYPPVRSLVYDQPSPVPVVWAAVLRLFPLAVAIVWPAVRAVPNELFDLALLDGLGVAGFFRRVVAPVAGPAFGVAAVAVAALALGEVSAGKVVAPPGYRAFVLDLFAQMHYGTDATVCGLCLLQLAATATGLTAARIVWLSTSRRTTRTAPSPAPDPPARSG